MAAYCCSGAGCGGATKKGKSAVWQACAGTRCPAQMVRLPKATRFYYALKPAGAGSGCAVCQQANGFKWRYYSRTRSYGAAMLARTVRVRQWRRRFLLVRQRWRGAAQNGAANLELYS
ncbi:hypothetical protein NPIL_393141 [Nephila pilipes]|uniref:Uncharacterized protein n=1 Tax=Nephila pilipes TaxID=299642 RepID=A0A8X6NIN7_NEPPI|nr:hypothetical protein NPIL_393141 [Nephila pilipes]